MLVDNPMTTSGSMALRMYSSLMGTFSLPPRISSIDVCPMYVIFSIATRHMVVTTYFKMLYFEDTSVVIIPNTW